MKFVQDELTFLRNHFADLLEASQRRKVVNKSTSDALTEILTQLMSIEPDIEVSLIRVHRRAILKAVEGLSNHLTVNIIPEYNKRLANPALEGRENYIERQAEAMEASALLETLIKKLS